MDYRSTSEITFESQELVWGFDLSELVIVRSAQQLKGSPSLPLPPVAISLNCASTLHRERPSMRNPSVQVLQTLAAHTVRQQRRWWYRPGQRATPSPPPSCPANSNYLQYSILTIKIASPVRHLRCKSHRFYSYPPSLGTVRGAQ